MIVSFQAAETVAVLASTVAIVIGLFVLFEKVSGVTGRWAAKQVQVGIAPLEEKIDTHNTDALRQAQADHLCIERRIGEVHDYNKYHLGPNGTTKPVHERISELENGMRLVLATDKERRRFQEFVDRVGQDMRGTQDPDEELED
ncbi:hypothetical protein UFOVP1279_14 [uncultured Caudovirales phage]|uniref:Uncharacterized protein n=1 Tax=uncultured Caudovirales phage TaxID=2100421 RepID=A0A6J5RDD7_9CAUD|nr:hypothetical protein UFOVP1279_14 [uncultured Caudovirales phage]